MDNFLGQEDKIIAHEYHELATQLMRDQGQEDILNPPIASGISYLDEMIGGGFKKGELIILSAPTKQGKSTLAQTITWNMGKNKKNSLWLTMEMSWQELTRKFMAMDESLKESKLPSYAPIFYPLDYYRQGGDLQMQWLKRVIWEAQEKQSVEFVVIDHLHFLLPLKDYNTNVSFLIGSIVREIKKIAVDLKIPIMLIVHMKKLEVDKRPDINSLRDSSFIAQESDFTMIMWRHRAEIKKIHSDDEDEGDVYTSKAYLSLEANRRNGRTGRLALWHDGAKFVKFEKNVHDLADDIKRVQDRQKQELEQMFK